MHKRGRRSILNACCIMQANIKITSRLSCTQRGATARVLRSEFVLQVQRDTGTGLCCVLGTDVVSYMYMYML